MWHSHLNDTIWEFLKQNVLFPKGMNWVQHCVSRIDQFFKVWHCLISYMLLKADLRYQTSFSDIFVNPGTSRCPTVDLELVQTTRNVNGTRHSVRKFQPGKRTHLFRFSIFSGNFTVGRTDETCSIYPRTGNSANFD